MSQVIFDGSVDDIMPGQSAHVRASINGSPYYAEVRISGANGDTLGRGTSTRSLDEAMVRACDRAYGTVQGIDAQEALKKLWPEQ